MQYNIKGTRYFSVQQVARLCRTDANKIRQQYLRPEDKKAQWFPNSQWVQDMGWIVSERDAIGFSRGVCGVSEGDIEEFYEREGLGYPATNNTK